jgi:hypothetical protein
MREAVITADVDIAWLHCGMSRIQAGPIAAKMRQMPLLVDETVFLLFCHFIIDKFASNTKIENERVFALPVFPVESLLELATGPCNAISGYLSWRWRGMEPTFIIFSKWIKKIICFVDPLTHSLG